MPFGESFTPLNNVPQSQPVAPTASTSSSQPNYWLGDTYSGSGIPTGSATAKATQGALENPTLPASKQTLQNAVNQYPSFGNTLAGLVGGSVGGGNNYSFENDPGVAMAKALENQGLGQLDAWLRNAREQQVIKFGDPALAGMAGFGLDPQAGAFAQQNYLSGNADLARINRAKELARQAIINRLAAHGLIRSGDLGYQEGQSAQDYGNQEYDARQAVLQKLADYMQQYLQQKQSLKQSTLNAYQNAYQNYANNPALLESAQAANTADILKRFFGG